MIRQSAENAWRSCEERLSHWCKFGVSDFVDIPTAQIQSERVRVGVLWLCARSQVWSVDSHALGPPVDQPAN